MMDEMKKPDDFWESKEWLAFEKAARERDFDPVELVFDFMRESIEVWEGEELHEAIRQDVQKYIEEHGDVDPVEFVKQVRRERRARLEAEEREAQILNAAA